MGIAPTSEAWEACCRHTETHKLAAFCRFSKFSNGFQLEQPEPQPSFVLPARELQDLPQLRRRDIWVGWHNPPRAHSH